MIRLVGVTKQFGTRKLFSNFSYEFPETGMIALLGDSGSGKSTILNLISGLDNDYEGTIEIDNVNFKKLSKSKIQDFRIKNIGYVFQNFNLLNLETVFNNVLLPLDTICNDKKSIKNQRVIDALRLVDMQSKKNNQINKLSGGEKQRVAIARSIINNPSVILCDEPTGALDSKNAEIVFNLLKQISKRKLVIIATHDAEEITKYADRILTIKNEEINEIKLDNDCEENGNLLIKFNKTKTTPKVTSFFKVNYSYHKLRAKKWRSVIVNLLLSLSLTGVGLSLILTQSVSSKVEEAFTTMLNGNQIVVSRKNELENTFTNVYSTSYKNVENIYQKYKYLCDGIGVNYMVNFEDFFKDNNEFYVYGKSKKISIDSLSARNINDFRWIENGDEGIYYPFSYDILDDDQVILGLSYEDMVQLCYQLQIQRNYTSLGHYIYENGLSLFLNVRNNYWQYDDEQLLNVVAVCESNKTTLFHTNLLWNEIVFEEMMLLPSDDDETHEFPWEMYKIYYLQTREDPSVFLNASLCDESLNSYIFERSNFDYNPIICNPYQSCDLRRIYIYSADTKSVISSELQNYLNEKSDVFDYYYTSDYGYASYSSNLFSGFSKNVFISDDSDSLDVAIDADSKVDSEVNLTINLPENVVQGNFLLSLTGGLRFSTDMSKLIYGRKASNLNEIVISKGLAEKYDNNSLCLGKYLEITGEIEEFYDSEEQLNKIYNRTKLLVVGIVDEPENYLYHFGNWTISFFRDKLGVSNFFLIPTGIVIEFPTKTAAENAFLEIKQLVRDLKVVSPIEELKTNIQTTLDYANTILIIFSILSLIISVLFLGTVVMLNILESKNDVNLLSVLGIKKNDTDSCFIVQSLMQGLISFVVSSIELIAVDIFLSFSIGKTLGIGFNFSFNSTPVLVIFLISVFIPFLVTKVMLLILNRRT